MSFVFSHVVPTKYLGLVRSVGSELLAEGSKLLTDKDYFNFFKRYRPFIIDQSCVFGSELSVIEYVNLIKELSPEYCFAPDVIGNLGSTLERFIDFNYLYIKNDLQCTPVYILQGRNAEEMMRCLDNVLEIEGNLVVGITSRYPDHFMLPVREIPSDWGMDRQLLIKEVVRYVNLIGEQDRIKFYLPGVWHLSELLMIPDSFIASDSSFCFQSSVLGKSVLLSRRTLNPVDWTSECDENLLINNIVTLENLIRGYRRDNVKKENL